MFFTPGLPKLRSWAVGSVSSLASETFLQAGDAVAGLLTTVSSFADGTAAFSDQWQKGGVKISAVVDGKYVVGSTHRAGSVGILRGAVGARTTQLQITHVFKSAKLFFESVRSGSIAANACSAGLISCQVAQKPSSSNGFYGV